MQLVKSIVDFHVCHLSSYQCMVVLARIVEKWLMHDVS